MRVLALLPAAMLALAGPSRAQDEERTPSEAKHSVEAGAAAVGAAPLVEGAGLAVDGSTAGKAGVEPGRAPILLQPPPGAEPGTIQVTGLDGPINIQGVASWEANSGPPPGTSCKVKPPNLSFGLVIHNNPEPGKYVLDSTPKVCDRAFCAAVGFPTRGCCPAGPEGSSERASCELNMMGVDPSDGRAGPHWMFVGAGTIKRHNTNPFLGIVHLTGPGGGTAYVCSNRRPVVCATVKVP